MRCGHEPNGLGGVPVVRQFFAECQLTTLFRGELGHDIMINGFAMIYFDALWVQDIMSSDDLNS